MSETEEQAEERLLRTPLYNLHLSWVRRWFLLRVTKCRFISVMVFLGASTYA